MSLSDVTNIQKSSLLTIHAPRWFLRDDFISFLEGRVSTQKSPPATWHIAGESPGEFSDVFLYVEGEEGSDAMDLPDDIRKALAITCADCGHSGVVRIVNL